MKSMTKMALAAAVATTVSAGANAVAVYGEVGADMQMTLLSSDLLAPPQASFVELIIAGDTTSDGIANTGDGLTMTGELTAFTANTYVKTVWTLTDGERQGANGSGGTIFRGGAIAISTSTDGGLTYNPFDTVDAAVNEIAFIAGGDGAYAPAPNQTTAGMVIDDAGFGTLPGLWDLQFFGVGWNNAVGALDLFGSKGGLFMTGSIAPVPVPAAAWLFGSALVGLAGVARKRNAA